MTKHIDRGYCPIMSTDAILMIAEFKRRMDSMMGLLNRGEESPFSAQQFRLLESTLEGVLVVLTTMRTEHDAAVDCLPFMQAERATVAE